MIPAGVTAVHIFLNLPGWPAGGALKLSAKRLTPPTATLTVTRPAAEPGQPGRATAVLATPKHYLGDGATLWGTSRMEMLGTKFSIDQGDVAEDEAALRHAAQAMLARVERLRPSPNGKVRYCISHVGRPS